jgi:lipopolysaccharide transport system ATP-binding protein
VQRVLTVEKVCKQFRIQSTRPASVKEFFIRRLTGDYKPARTLWALSDVSFSLEKGRVLGIIGHNGAGKSTLLRLLSGLGRPTSGKILRSGNFGSLLELGTGFHTEMTGRENLITGGILSGLTRREVTAKQDEIIAFSELEEFIDQPVKTYSSGMYLRLAFSAAIHFDPDAMIIDEVLAVGDSRFQHKCIERLNSFRNAGKSLIFVSHDLDQIRSLCDEVLVLERGSVAIQSEPVSAIEYYHDLMRKRTESRTSGFSEKTASSTAPVGNGKRFGTLEAMISDVRLYNMKGEPDRKVVSGQGLTIELEYRLEKPLADMAVILGIYTDSNIKCFEAMLPSCNSVFGAICRQKKLICEIGSLPLLAGRYFINLGLYPPDWDYVYDYQWQMHSFDVLSADPLLSGITGFVALEHTWSLPEQIKNPNECLSL